MVDDAGPVGRTFRARLAHDISAPARARALVRDGLSPSLPPGSPVLDDAVLIVHELVCNSLAHGPPVAGDIEVEGRVDDGQVILSVADGGSAGTVEALPFTLDGEGGRGLSIVAALATSWSVDRSAGTRVTARIEL